jgi:hypothetical protein
MMRGSLKGNASVLLENQDEMPPKATLEASGYGFYASGETQEMFARHAIPHFASKK